MKALFALDHCGVRTPDGAPLLHDRSRKELGPLEIGSSPSSRRPSWNRTGSGSSSRASSIPWKEHDELFPGLSGLEPSGISQDWHHVLERKGRPMSSSDPSRYRSQIVSLVLVITGVTAFNGCITGTDCEYEQIPGTCTITTWQDSVDSGYNCTEDSVEVTFDFVPDSSGEETINGVGYTVGGGTIYNPPRAWLQEVGLTEGSSHRCTLHSATSGSCTPRMFYFNDIDEDSYSEYCD